DHSGIVRLLILAAWRRQEVGGMRWSEFEDLATGIWTIPGERTKNHRAHTLALPPAAIRIVRSQADMRFAARGEREHLFGVRSGRGYAAWDHGKAELDRRLNGTVKPWRLHDIRRTVATKMADTGVEPHIIEQVLNHQSGHKAGPAGIYNRSVYERQVKAALIRWSAHVHALVEGRDERKVVTL